MHIYAFGSICRGEFDEYSDIDLLAIVEDIAMCGLNSEQFSIYSYRRLQELWLEGNPFAWHLSIEARLLYSSSNADYLESLEVPAKYCKSKTDCERFVVLFHQASIALESSSSSQVFELSNIYLAIRNFATCYALGILGKMEFSRYSPLRLGNDSLAISKDNLFILLKARVLCTRGLGQDISKTERESVTKDFLKIDRWMDRLIKVM